MRILGISAHYHDSAAALLVDGRIVAAAQEERFTRRKHEASFPLQAARFCLREGGLEADDLDAVAYYEKPFQKFDRILTEVLVEMPRSLLRFTEAVPRWLRSRLWVRGEVERELETTAPVRFLRHHESHAAAAFGPSPFTEAAVLTLDGVGEWTTNGIWQARGSELTPLKEIRYPHSPGLLYSAFTAYCGFKVNDGEYKLMGLAPYGQPRFVQTILDHLVDLKEDGSFRLNPRYFAYRYAPRMVNERFHRLFDGPPRSPESPLGPRDADLARSIQTVIEEVVLRQAKHARQLTGLPNLCLAGGVALNCVANGRLLRQGIFDRVWFQPAAGDAGGSLGAAYALWFRERRPEREARDRDDQQTSLLGPAFDDDAIEEALREVGLDFERLDEDTLIDRTARDLADGATVGWYQGRMEFGPRALGNRSILADPRGLHVQSHVNRAIKFRESFRPFAPVVSERHADDWFDMPDHSPYMLLVGSVRNAEPMAEPLKVLEAARGIPEIDSPIPAVTHVDGSARVQTVREGDNPRLERLLERFHELTGCPVLLNTSFNVRDEPIICAPREAVACLLKTQLDRLVMGPFRVERPADPPPPPEPAPSEEPVRAGRVLLDVIGTFAAFALLWWAVESPPLAIAAASLGGVLMTLRLVHPRARAAVGRGAVFVGSGIVRALSFVILTVVYVLLVAPLGLLTRLQGGYGAEENGPETAWQEPDQTDDDAARPY